MIISGAIKERERERVIHTHTHTHTHTQNHAYKHTYSHTCTLAHLHAQTSTTTETAVREGFTQSYVINIPQNSTEEVKTGEVSEVKSRAEPKSISFMVPCPPPDNRMFSGYTRVGWIERT